MFLRMVTDDYGEVRELMMWYGIIAGIGGQYGRGGQTGQKADEMIGWRSFIAQCRAMPSGWLKIPLVFLEKTFPSLAKLKKECILTCMGEMLLDGRRHCEVAYRKYYGNRFC